MLAWKLILKSVFFSNCRTRRSPYCFAHFIGCHQNIGRHVHGWLQTSSRLPSILCREANAALTRYDLDPQGSLGVLDIVTSSYDTIMRSHTDIVNDFSIDNIRRHLVTASRDGSLRVWNLDTSQQVGFARGSKVSLMAH